MCMDDNSSAGKWVAWLIKNQVLQLCVCVCTCFLDSFVYKKNSLKRMERRQKLTKKIRLRRMYTLSRLRSTCPEFDSNTCYFGQYEMRNCGKRSKIVRKDSKEPHEALKTFWYTYDKSIQRFAEIWSKLQIYVRISDMSHSEENLGSQWRSERENAAESCF